MNDTVTNPNKHNFKNLPEEVHKELSAKGGKAKGLKGLAYLKLHDPKRFKEITSKGGKSKEKRVREV